MTESKRICYQKHFEKLYLCKKSILRLKFKNDIQDTSLLHLIMIRASMSFVSVRHYLEFYWTLNMILIFWNLRIKQNNIFINLSLKWAWISLIKVNDLYFQKILQNRMFEQKNFSLLWWEVRIIERTKQSSVVMKSFINSWTWF